MSERFGVRWALGAMLAASILIPLALYGGISWYLRAERLREGLENVQQTRLLLEEHAHRVFEAQELTIAQIDARIHGMSWDEIRESEALHRFLSELARSSDHIDGLWLIPPDGRTANSADVFPFPPVDTTHRDYFRALEAADTLYFGEIIVGKVKGTLNFNVSRRRSPTARFDGLILVTASLDYFTHFWDEAFSHETHVAGLFRPDGEILARYPPLDGLPERLASDSPLLSAMARADSGLETATSSVDGTKRVYGYSRIADYPVYIGFGIAEAELLAPWRRDMPYHGLIALTASLLLASLVLVASGQSRKLTTAMVSWRDTAARLQQEVDRREKAEHLVDEKERLLARLHEATEERKAILDTMVEGVVAYDAEGEIIYCNRASQRILRIAETEQPDFAGLAAAGRLVRLDDAEVPPAEAPDRRVLSGGLLAQEELRILSAEPSDPIVCRFQGAPLRDRAGAVVGAVLTFADITEEKNSEERRELLMAELDHRVRNMLATILAMVRISSGHAATKQDLAEALTGRIAAMGRTHGRLTASGWRGVGLRQIVEDELEPYAGEGRVLVEESRDVVLPPKDAVNLSLVLHELATNAVKYGALSSDSGRVEIGWTRRTRDDGGGPLLRVIWREQGGPPVESPTRQGFGTTIVNSAFRGGEGADVDLRFEPGGVTCEILLPLREAGLTPLPAAPMPRHVRQEPERPLAGRRVLLVEDEPTVRLEMAETLERAGATVVGPAADLGRGLALAAAGGFDLALLDLNLEGESVNPLALALHERGVPLVFLTGYRNLALLAPGLRHLPKLQKPAEPAEVVALLAAATDARQQEDEGQEAS